MGLDTQANDILRSHPNVALHATHIAIHLVSHRLHPEHQSPFRVVADQILERSNALQTLELGDAYDEWGKACGDVAFILENLPHPSGHAFNCVIAAFECAREVVSSAKRDPELRIIPNYDLGDGDYGRIIRDAVRCSREPLSVFSARLRALLAAHQAGDLTKQHARMSRMPFVPPEGLGKRLQEAAKTIAIGGTWSWETVAGSEMLKVEGQDGRVFLRLSPDDRNTFEPWLGSITPPLATPSSS